MNEKQVSTQNKEAALTHEALGSRLRSPALETYSPRVLRSREGVENHTLKMQSID